MNVNSDSDGTSNNELGMHNCCYISTAIAEADPLPPSVPVSQPECLVLPFCAQTHPDDSSDMRVPASVDRTPAQICSPACRQHVVGTSADGAAAMARQRLSSACLSLRISCLVVGCTTSVAVHSLRAPSVPHVTTSLCLANKQLCFLPASTAEYTATVPQEFMAQNGAMTHVQHVLHTRHLRE